MSHAEPSAVERGEHMVMSKVAGDGGEGDGQPRRTGTMWTASAHIITAVIGSGVLSLAWGVAQLGWVAGPAVMVLFGAVIYCCSVLLVECYRSGDPFTGQRNRTYMDAVRASLGGTKVMFSQIPNLHKMWWLSTLASAMSLSYSAIGIALGVAQIVVLNMFEIEFAANGGVRGTITGVFVGAGAGVTSMQKDTVKPVAPPSTETKVMRKAVAVSVATTTVVYLMCGCVGYAAFGNDSPDNLLTGFGFFEPFWLLDLANAGVVVHLVGTYQVVAQPVFAFLDGRAAVGAWPGSAALGKRRVVRVGSFAAIEVSPFRLAWRTAFVCVTTAASTLLPFFGSMVGLIGAASFWPLTVYFPVEMYIAQRRVARWSAQWLSLQALSAGCLVVSIAASAGSIAGIVEAFKAHNPFCWTC
uniref:Amino acid transporter transmembrane domain-containing protein n=1 Tax=Oryza punctata TaxID=4537 RepID=A0A0E0L0M9_ORYPU